VSLHRTHDQANQYRDECEAQKTSEKASRPSTWVQAIYPQPPPSIPLTRELIYLHQRHHAKQPVSALRLWQRKNKASLSRVRSSQDSQDRHHVGASQCLFSRSAQLLPTGSRNSERIHRHLIEPPLPINEAHDTEPFTCDQAIGAAGGFSCRQP
jgi:hypothetical protein